MPVQSHYDFVVALLYLHSRVLVCARACLRTETVDGRIRAPRYPRARDCSAGVGCHPCQRLDLNGIRWRGGAGKTLGWEALGLLTTMVRSDRPISCDAVAIVIIWDARGAAFRSDPSHITLIDHPKVSISQR